MLVEEGGQRFGEGGLPRRAGGERWEGESGGELLRGEREGGDHAEEEEA